MFTDKLSGDELPESSDSVTAGQVVSLSPKAMVDSVADWSLPRVVNYLQKKEREEKSGAALDCRVYHTSGIRLFNLIVDEVGHEYDVSRGKMCRWLSYHGLAMAKDDDLVARLSRLYAQVRQTALSSNSNAVAAIQDNLTPYAPLDEDGKRISFYVYDSWVFSDFVELSRTCGVATSQMAQVYMLRSVITCDIPVLQNVAVRMQQEFDWWSKWMRYRLSTLEMAVAIWESV